MRKFFGMLLVTATCIQICPAFFPSATNRLLAAGMGDFAQYFSAESPTNFLKTQIHAFMSRYPLWRLEQDVMREAAKIRSTEEFLMNLENWPELEGSSRYAFQELRDKLIDTHIHFVYEASRAQLQRFRVLVSPYSYPAQEIEKTLAEKLENFGQFEDFLSHPGLINDLSQAALEFPNLKGNLTEMPDYKNRIADLFKKTKDRTRWNSLSLSTLFQVCLQLAGSPDVFLWLIRNFGAEMVVTTMDVNIRSAMPFFIRTGANADHIEKLVAEMRIYFGTDSRWERVIGLLIVQAKESLLGENRMTAKEFDALIKELFLPSTQKFIRQEMGIKVPLELHLQVCKQSMKGFLNRFRRKN